MSGKLEGRKAFVTGAGSGIGRATALRLAADGAQVVAMSLSTDTVAETVELVNAAGGPKALAVAGDVGDESMVADSIAAAVTHMGGLDILVTAAGITLNGATHEVSLADWDLVLRTNLTGTFLPIKHALPHLVEHGSSSIVTIGSTATLVAAGRVVSYDASKAGVAGVTRFVAAEYAGRGVRANCVCPGGVDTNIITGSRRFSPDDPAWDQGGPWWRAARVQSVPMQRYAAPAEIAAAVAFLSSNDASFLTGAVLPVDGGYLAV